MRALVLVKEGSSGYETLIADREMKVFANDVGLKKSAVRSFDKQTDHETLFLDGKLEVALSGMSDDELLDSTETAVETERRQGVIVVKHFNEIFRRQLFLARGYPSMFEMLRKRFRYCAGSAQLRISSMKLINDVPEVEAKLETGELSMSAAAQLQTFFRAETKINKSYSPREKLELVRMCERKSTREVERELAAINPTIVKTEFVKPVSATQSKITLTVSNELIEKLERLRAEFSHVKSEKNEILNYEEVLSRLADSVLAKIDRANEKKKGLGESSFADPSRSPTPGSSFSTSSESSPNTSTQPAARTKSQVHAHETVVEKSRYITVDVRREVIARNAGLGCAFTDSKAGRRCGSQSFLQVDHIKPYSLGGTNQPDNLRVLCGSHNRFVWRTRCK